MTNDQQRNMKSLGYTEVADLMEHGGATINEVAALYARAVELLRQAALATNPQQEPVSRHPTIAECEAAGIGPRNAPGKPYEVGGLPDTPEERARFEAYMRGHCWAVGSYDELTRGYDTVLVRMLYGVWRDRGSLSVAHPLPPQGWVLVPAEPSPAMLMAAMKSFESVEIFAVLAEIRNAYRAMIEAAQKGESK